MAYRTEVQADSSGTWAGNGLFFKTRKEAEAYANDLFCRWAAVRQWRVVRSTNPVNYVWKNDRAVSVGTSAAVTIDTDDSHETLGDTGGSDA